MIVGGHDWLRFHTLNYYTNLPLVWNIGQMPLVFCEDIVNRLQVQGAMQWYQNVQFFENEK